jgi:SagB-type dehydrogenase family enzyme
MHFIRHTGILLILLIAVVSAALFLMPYANKIPITSNAKSDVKIKLPAPIFYSKTSIEEAIRDRRSIRQYQDKPIPLHKLAQLLWAAQGITSKEGFRTTPSAGALYPLEIYLVSGNVEGLSVGLYHYRPVDHVLELLSETDVRADLTTAAHGQLSIKQGAANIVITAAYARSITKYGTRGKRFAHMEAGHAAQNIYLQAISLNLGTVAIGGFDEAKVKSIMHISSEENPLYILPIGNIGDSEINGP